MKMSTDLQPKPYGYAISDTSLPYIFFHFLLYNYVIIDRLIDLQRRR